MSAGDSSVTIKSKPFTIDGAFKVVLMALVGFMGWQQRSMTNEIAAARQERQEEAEESRKERTQLTAWALGVTNQVKEVKIEVTAARVVAQ